MTKKSPNWQFMDGKGTFQLKNPHYYNTLYFPLVNEAGMMSAVTPTLKGDIKINQNAFLTLPVSLEDLHTNQSARNFWVQVDSSEPWSVTGNSARQTTEKYVGTPSEEISMEAGFLWHKITRLNKNLGLRAEITSFVPSSEDQIELMQVVLINISDEIIKVTPTAAIPIFGRSADNLRDHRHVTSLLHRIRCHPYGVLVRPTLSFDERGHLPNTLTYAVLGCGEKGEKPSGFYPKVDGFIGQGGTLEWPEAIINNNPPTHQQGQTCAGYEAFGGIRFNSVDLNPGESTSFVIILAILEQDEPIHPIIETYGRSGAFNLWLERTKDSWNKKLEGFKIKTGDSRLDQWLRWVSIQPTLRRLFGNSFLPAHDYGRGGRGWRDLWQDILALLLVEGEGVRESLFRNFAGVRFDGSNATIIGSAPGEFKADRNNIPRVWMDHGAWPLLTTSLYLHQTGDLPFLLREQVYFKDHLVARSKKIDPNWKPEQGTQLKIETGEPHLGTILEHLLIQHLTQFFNVGEHNIILLEDADWNDGMDLAPERGESVAFSAFYAGNLHQLSEWALTLAESGVDKVTLAAELFPLLDTIESKINYDSVDDKQLVLQNYFDSCQHTLSGRKMTIPLRELGKDLKIKADWLTKHICRNEWIKDQAGYGWFNSYYDNDGQRVEGDHPNGVRMILTGQVFALMGGVANADQAIEIVRSLDQYLYDPAVGGYRLNTDFGEVMLNLGRAFGFAYGHKENGAMFSHMAVMYAYSLYQRCLVDEGYKALNNIYQHCQDFPISQIYPGIPEYTDPNGRGMYTWLTGSASWYLLTMITEVFGVRGYLGDLILTPKLTRFEFDDNGYASLITRFADKLVEVIYQNPHHLDHNQYQVQSVSIDGKTMDHSANEYPVRIKREIIESSSGNKLKIEVLLGSQDKK